MKKIVLLTIAFYATTLACAQNFSTRQFATLSRNDTIVGTYYGGNALRDALNQAQNGDVITLSSGNFTSYETFQPSVTIRGIGYTTDSIVEIGPTIITAYYGYTNIYGNVQIEMEGVFFAGELRCSASNSRFSKCRITTFRAGGGGNNTISNCVIDNHISRETPPNVFMNNVILNYTYSQTYATSYNPSSDVFNNCIIGVSPALTNYLHINNCITFYTDTIPSQGNADNVYNTVGIRPNDTAVFYQDRTGHNNLTVHSYSSIFKTFNGTYIDGETFELQDNVSNTLLGSDSTQIGLYGGSLPFNSRVTDPRIISYSVDLNSNSNNELKVYIGLDNSNN